MSSHGQQNNGGYDHVPPTQYLDAGGEPGDDNRRRGQNPEPDPYHQPHAGGAYDEYVRPDSFDVSYYTDSHDPVYLANDRNYPMPVPQPLAGAPADPSPHQQQHPVANDPYSYDAYDAHRSATGNLLSPDAPLADMSMQGSHPGKQKRRSGKHRSGADSDYETMSDGAFSIRSSLVRTPASRASGEVDVFGAY
ncbi:hypothetical protein EV182_007697, partial [Spiromyces aspiralis]